MSDTRRWPHVLLFAASVIAIAGAATARVIVAGEEEVAASTRALEGGDAREAIVRSRRAALWYAPGAPHVTVAYDRLIALGQAAEQERRDDLALLAWRGVRVAVIETQWLVPHHQRELEQADRAIARIVAKKPRAAQPDARIAAEQLQKLRRHEPPRRVWVMLLFAGFVLAAGGLVVWARQVADAGGRLAWARGKWGLLLTVIGATIWLVSIWRA